jgi:hypothetical protein
MGFRGAESLPVRQVKAQLRHSLPQAKTFFFARSWAWKIILRCRLRSFRTDDVSRLL